MRILDNLLTGSKDQVPDGAEFLEGDVRSAADSDAAVQGVDVVFHQAAIRSVASSIEDPILTQTTNVQGTLQILMAARGAGVRRVINASTCAVYGEHGNAAREDQPPDPRSPYAVAKLAAEQYARLFSREYGLDVMTLRYFNVFGPRQHPESAYSAVFPAFIAALSAGRAPQIFGDGEQTRDFVSVEDVVRANLLAATAPSLPAGEALNIGSGTPRSVNETLRAIASACGTWIEPRTMPPRPGDVRHSSADVSRARAVLGFQATSDFGEAVAATVTWLTRGGA